MIQTHFLLALVLVLSLQDAVAAKIDCLDERGQALGIINESVIEWKQNTPNQTKKRARVFGNIVRLFRNRTGHHHFEIALGKNPSDTLEVIYNDNFGDLGDLNLGSQVEACGDYITATRQAGPYPPSPSGAIIHWVHQAPNPGRHQHGFLIIDGVLYGWQQGKDSSN